MEDAQFEDAEIEYIGLKFEKENLNDGPDDEYYKVGLHRVSGLFIYPVIGRIKKMWCRLSGLDELADKRTDFG